MTLWKSKILQLKKKTIKKQVPKTVRFAPNPTYFAHLGHLRGLIALKNFSKKGVHLRFDDTSSEICKKEYFRSFIKLFKIHNIPCLSISYASKNSKYYKLALRKLFLKNKIYCCNCPKQTLKKYRQQCDCKNKKLPFKMQHFSVIRFKTNIPHDSDYVIYRYCEVKKMFLPTLCFQTAVDDIRLGTSHLLRGLDLKSSQPRLKEVYSSLSNKKFMECSYWGRISIYNSKTGAKYQLSKRARASQTQLPALPKLYSLVTPEKIEKILKDYGFTDKNINVDINRFIE